MLQDACGLPIFKWIVSQISAVTLTQVKRIKDKLIT